MGFSRHVMGVGIVAVLILINLEFFLRRAFGIDTSIPSDPIYNYKQEFSVNNNELHADKIVNMIRNHDVMNLSTNATVHMPTSSDLSFTKTQEAIQRARRTQIRDTCTKYNLDGAFLHLTESRLHRLIVDEKYKLIYCSVPKIASTSWKRVLLVLRGVMNDTYDLSQSELNNNIAPKKLKFLHSYPQEDIRPMLKEYTKFLVVRDPFSRVLSAFRNKLAPNSDFRKASLWQKSTGMRILKKYKPSKAPSRSVFKRLSTPSGVVRYDLNMADFVKFLVNPLERNDNEHWTEIHKLCSPCLIEYDIISKFETLEADAKYILGLVHADSVVNFPSSTGSSPTNSSKLAVMKSYYTDVTQKDFEKLYNRFKLDFELFGYEKPVMSF